jgi:hypothetical protein
MHTMSTWFWHKIEYDKTGDLVLKKDIRTKNRRKFSLPWEGPFILVDIAALGAYVFAEVDGGMLPNT